MSSLKLLIAANALFLASPSHATQERVVRIAPAEGIALRAQPSTSAEIVKKLDVGDGVSVIKKELFDGQEWAYVKAEHCVKGNDCARIGQGWTMAQGWIPDQDLAYEARFERVTSWPRRSIEAGAGDYWFTMDIAVDGAVSLRFRPCVDCGETGDCPENYEKEGEECVGRGHLFRYRNFVWAKGVHAQFFVDEQGELCSVYSGEQGHYCTRNASTQPGAADASRR